MNRLWIFTFAGVLLAGSAFASTLASDNAGNAVYSNAWLNGQNGGTGFGVWTQKVYTTGGGVGFFYANSYVSNPATIAPGIDISGRSWGLSVSNTAAGTTFAMRPFTGGSMSSGQTFEVCLQNGFVDGGSVGIDLRNGTSMTAYNTGERLSLYYSGGWHIFDGHTNPNLLTYDTGGFKIDFTLTGANTYSLTMTNLDPAAAAGNRSITVTGTLAGTSGAGIDSVALYSQQNKADAYHNMYFNSMAIIPEPSSVALVGMGLLGLLILRRRN